MALEPSRRSSPHAAGVVAQPMHRSYLFVPGNRPDRFDKACATRAHAVIVDLEDAVPAADKREARASVAAWLAAERPVIVRINAADSEWFDDDLRTCANGGVAAIVLPKAERVEDIRRIGYVCGDLPVLPLIESARGLWNAHTVAQAAHVQALLFGSLDFQADIGASDDDLLYARSQLVVASRVAGVAAPVDGVTQSIDDPELLRRDCLRSRQLGFGGKLCIHPAQVDIVNDCFSPSSEEIAWAEEVVAAFERGGGSAVRVDGRMVDRPVLLQAQAILEERAAMRR
jgi:citrate lyase subunit beta / citryl-CoA lyase